MKKLNGLVSKDPRLKKVYDWAKERYQELDLPQHNWEHVMRDLYRSLLIADSEPGVDYSILVPAVLLHDVGYQDANHRQHHTESAKIAQNLLPGLGYSKDEIGKISAAISSHGGDSEPESLEAKILFDADQLEKSGIGGIFTLYRVQYELEIPLRDFINLVRNKIKKIKEQGFYTLKAKELCGQGLDEYLDHFDRVEEGLLKRPDFLVCEKDLWD